jgi:hypothetical protein
MLPFAPMPLGKRVSAFNGPEWLFELKYDGFRALACFDNGRCTLVSRNGNIFKSFPDLCEDMGRGLAVRGSTVRSSASTGAAALSSTTFSTAAARLCLWRSTYCAAAPKTCGISPSPTASTN